MLFAPFQLCLPPATHPPAQLCRACYVAKPLTDFRFRPQQQQYRYTCKPCEAAKARTRRATADEAHREVERRRSAGRREYHLNWVVRNRPRVNEQARLIYQAQPKSCPIYVLTCEITQQLFVARLPTTKYSLKGRRVAESQAARARAARVHTQLAPSYTCRVCHYQFTPLYGFKHRAFCSPECQQKQRLLNKREAKKAKRAERGRGANSSAAVPA